MSVRVLLPNAFQKHTNGAKEITSNAGNLPALLTEIETTFPDLKTHLRDESGQVRRFINFYVNEEDIRFLGNEKYAFKDGDEVLVIPSIAGGSFTDARSAVAWTASPARGETPSAHDGDTCGRLCSCCSYCGQEPCCCGD
ncbi:MAG: MoaD/ThiS family protein [Acidobacteriaceae bacterium]